MTLGPVRPHKNGASFDVRGFINREKAGFTITIAPGMPEGSIWDAWAWELQEADLCVRRDAAYQAILDAAAARDDEGGTLH